MGNLQKLTFKKLQIYVMQLITVRVMCTTNVMHSNTFHHQETDID